MKLVVRGALALLMCAVAIAPAWGQVTIPQEYDKTIKSAEAVGALGPNLFGDQTSFYTGATTFSATDVSLPGNSSLPVAVGRRFVVQSRDAEAVSNLLTADGMFADWELDIPHLHGVFSAGGYGGASGWQVKNFSPLGGQGDPNLRCSAQGMLEPPVADGSFEGIWEPGEYWHGYNAYLPGVGDQEMLSVKTSNPHQPSDGKTYEWVTSNQWYFSCLPSTANGVPGEGFLAIAPDGTRYWFDWFASRAIATIVKEKGAVQGFSASGESTAGTTETSSDELTPMSPVGDKTSLIRTEVWILPTRVEDRFGNYVTYTYDIAHPWRLTTIAANDGRQLTLGYNTAGDIASVSDGARTWTYVYSGGLTEVRLPDASKWVINFGTVRNAYTAPQPNQNIVAFCEQPSSGVTQSIYTGTITHPSGAVGEFQFQSKLHGRSYVPKVCIKPNPYNTADYAQFPFYFDTVGLIQKKISGPGLPVAQWTYTYGPPNNSWAENCTGGCVATKTVEVTGPGDYRRYTFGNKFQETDGKLLKVETGSASTSILSTETTTYLLDPTNQTYPTIVGLSPYDRGDQTAEKLTPTIQRQITQQGATFTWQVNQTGGIYSLDQFANPLSVTRSSSLGATRTDIAAYHHNLSKWVLGQLASSTNSDTASVEKQTDYDADALPWKTYAFGKLLQTATYDTTSAVSTGQRGTLKTVSDGRDSGTYNTTITFGSWKRGIPQSISYPDSTSESALVHDAGWITSVTDENGYTTGYGYDAMGRLASIAYPTGDSVAWNATTQTFAPIATTEYGIPAGHWKQTVSTGNGRQVTYFDAMWRPLVSERYDTGNVTATRSVSVTRYDAGGHPVFQSYPLGSLTDYATVAQGTHTTYDALDRVTTTQQNWENDATAGLLTTTNEYLTGFQTRVTNPRGKVTTTTSYRAYDQPNTDLPLAVTHPEGAYTYVSRDTFGKPTQLTRRNADGSVKETRTYIYDDYQQLCKRMDPEAGSTLMGYDAAGNLAWSAAGVSNGTACDLEGDTAAILARKTVRTYDQRNRVSSLSFPDNVGNTDYTYTPDGLPASLVADNGGTNLLTTSYDYNKRRLPISERMQWGGIDWSLGYTYSGNGHLSSQTYPGSLTVTYAPNALGHPTQAGTYATGVSYFPNGAIKQFTYGNGIVHTLTQNTRQLPDRSKDVYSTSPAVLDDSYDFDANANVAAISDGLLGARGNRTMTYDGLDRLKTTVSPMFGASGATYTYDVLDNLTRVTVGGTAARDHYYCYDANWQLTNVKTTSCSGTSVIGLGYDVQGNLANKNGVLYTFDYGNRLRTVSGSPASSYVYDGHGRRVRDYTTAAKHSLYSQSGQLTFDSDARQAQQHQYIYLGGSLVAIREKNTSTGLYTTKYQHTDALGSPVAVTDASGNVIERSEYEPYGKVLNRPIHDGPGYTGHVEDAATGLTYMQQRYYDPGIGRFLSVDPVTADGNTGGNFNRYKYAANNPYKFTDPDGRLEAPNPQFFKGAAMGIIDTIVESATGMCGETVSVFGGADGDIAAGGYKFGHALGNAGLVMAPGRGVGGLVSTEGRVAKATVVTPAKVESALAGSTMQTTQNAVSLPVVQRYVNALENGSPAPAIKVADGVIVDGNHRYVAGRVAGQEPAVQAGTIAPSQVSQVKPIQEIKVDPTDWGNE